MMKHLYKYLALASVLMLTSCGIFNKNPRSSEYRKLLPVEMSDAPEQMMTKKGFVVSYNCDTRLPNWVFWQLTRDHTDGTAAKPGSRYREDSKVPKPRATGQDYRRKDFVRALMCPAEDNKWSSASMSDAYKYSNICPQTERCHSVWNSIEAMCRDWAKENNEIYIVSGPILSKDHDTIGPNEVAVPDAFFKVVVCLNGRKRGIGFICDNTDQRQTMKQCVVTIEEIESLTGLYFFPNLNAKDRDTVKGKANLRDW